MRSGWIGVCRVDEELIGRGPLRGTVLKAKAQGAQPVVRLGNTQLSPAAVDLVVTRYSVSSVHSHSFLENSEGLASPLPEGNLGVLISSRWDTEKTGSGAFTAWRLIRAD